MYIDKNLLIKDLKLINEKLKTTKEEENKKLLLVDRNYINKYLDIEEKKDTYNKIQDTNFEKFTNIIRTSYIKNIKINKKFLFVNKPSEEKIYKLYKKFIDENVFELKKYVGKDTIIVEMPENKSYFGIAVTLSSINKSYINLCVENNPILKYITLVHELSHVKVRLNQKNKKQYSSNFSEAFPCFMELLFLDYLYIEGYQKQSYNYKRKNIKKYFDYIYSILDELADFPLNNKNNKAVFIKEYKEFIGKLLGYYFYDLYKKDKEKAIYKIEKFCKNIDYLSDDELLNVIDFDINTSSKQILKNYINDLNKEKELIK